MEQTTVTTIKKAIKAAGFEIAQTRSTATGRASSQRVAINEGIVIERNDETTALLFTSDADATKASCTAIAEAIWNLGGNARCKVLSMDKTAGTFTYYVEVK